jgi:ketosteroid isomerase-like protein
VEPVMERDKITREILSIREEIVDAFNCHDPKRILAHINDNEDLHYVEHIQITIGWKTLKTGFEQWHQANLDLSIQITYSHVNVLSEQVAILISSGDIIKQGKKIQTMTWTAIFKKIEGSWKIVNAHETVMGV